MSSTACRRNPPCQRMHPTPGAAEARLGHSPSTNAKGPTSTLSTSLSSAIDRHTRVQLGTLPLTRWQYLLITTMDLSIKSNTSRKYDTCSNHESDDTPWLYNCNLYKRLC